MSLSATPVARWLDAHGDVLWRFVLGRTRSRQAAEDILQETVLAALQGRAAFAGASSERTWLLGIAAHKVADHFRAARQRSGSESPVSGVHAPPDSADLEGMFNQQGMWAKRPGAWGLGPESATENAEMLAALRRCIDALPPSQAEAVWLRDLLDVPAGEVCKVMGISPTNLWSRMHRARAALRTCVEKSMGKPKGDTP